MYNHEPYILFSIIYIRNAVYVRKKENNFNSFHLEATQKKKTAWLYSLHYKKT